MPCRPRVAVAVLAGLISCGVVSAPSAAPRKITEGDLLRFEWEADPEISPGGQRVAFVRVKIDSAADEYRTSVWVVDASGGEPRPFTAGPHDTQPRWSPDGSSLAFVRGAEGKPGQIWLLPLAGGEPSALTKVKGGAGSPAWSPDGKRVAFTSGTNPALDDDTTRVKPKHEPGRVVTKPIFRQNGQGFIEFDHPDHIWVISAAGGAARQLTTGIFDEGGPRWSRDGKWIYFGSDRRKQPWFETDDNNLYAVSPDLARPTDGVEMKVVVDFHGPVGPFVEGPDGAIATIGNLQPGDVKQVRSYDQDDLLLADGAWPRRTVRNLTADYDFDVGGGIASDQHPPRGGGVRPLAFDPDGRAVTTVVARHGSSMLARIDRASGAVTQLTDSTREVIAGTVSADGRRWALTLGDVSHPGDLYLYDAGGGALRKLWGPNDELFAGLKLGTVESFWYRSFDGTAIQAWLMKPPDFDARKKYPMILEIHGGPHTAYGVGFFHEFQELAAAGYLVLYTNPRGSTSYGQAFGNVIQYHYPGDDYRDLMAGVDEVLKRGFVDEKRLGVTGGSGGGLLTNWTITQTNRFAAALTDRCVSEWESFYYSADFTLFTPTWFRKPPFEDPKDYHERSPVSYASRITTPLMIIDGEEDWRTPIGQSEAMFRALKQQKKPAVMVRFPGESHELSRSGTPSRRVQRLHHGRQWFDKWLLGKPIKDYEE